MTLSNQGIQLLDPLWTTETGTPPWWDPNEAGLSVIGAWRAVDTPGSPWGAGPADYAASLDDLTGNGNTLAEIGGGSPNWSSAAGWSGFSTLSRCLDTGLVPANDQSWSMFVQFGNFVLLATTALLAGTNNAANRRFWLGNLNAVNNKASYGNGGISNRAPALLAGNLGIGGAQPYRNGVADGPAVGAWAGASALTIFIGGCNNGALSLPCTSDIHSAVVYDSDPAAVQAEALAIATAMAAL